ncbi:hypothetical protein Bpfe_003864 [Biomphalaria pfeifferi]|uniref:Uncharacterized protein n=1 Tax=Biomphalaria pfeifferi TaxID=112525 RepID=A0AAD8C4Q5_BIOPF|nr:hypothetical protein Bpfe_003864 [Biomphalaria pfeifferi]
MRLKRPQEEQGDTFTFRSECFKRLYVQNGDPNYGSKFKCVHTYFLPCFHYSDQTLGSSRDASRSQACTTLSMYALTHSKRKKNIQEKEQRVEEVRRCINESSTRKYPP